MTAPDINVPEHESSEAITVAARWLAANRTSLDRPIVPTLKERFGLSALDAIRAAAEAVRYEYVGGAR